MKTIKKTILSFTLVFFMMILPVGDSAGMVTAQAQTMVYVTPTGSKYHTHKCGRGNFYQTTLSNALARGLTPCKKCFGSSGGYSQTRKSSTTTTKKTTKKKNTLYRKFPALSFYKHNLCTADRQRTYLRSGVLFLRCLLRGCRGRFPRLRISAR